MERFLGLLVVNFALAPRSVQGLPQDPRTSQPRCNRSYTACVAKCLKDFRFDNLVRYVGESAGFPRVAEYASELTVTGTAISLVNQALNLTSLGRYPRGGPGRPAGSPTSWQHTVASRLGRALHPKAISRGVGRGARTFIGFAGKATGRLAARVSVGFLALEVSYSIGIAGSCATLCADCKNR